MVAVSSWGRLTNLDHSVIEMSDRSPIAAVIGGTKPGLAFGMGRSYGDVCLNPSGTLWSTRGLDRFISFDEVTGCLVCEPGILLREIQELMIPRGWILPVTPGTQMVTVGGAIANDVHGKNNHLEGSFGDHVKKIKLIRTTGEIIVCGPREKANWFSATVGGLGLTGFVAEVEIQLKRVLGPWLETETIPFNSLDSFFHLSDQSETKWEHTVSWIDCLSRGNARGLFMRGNWTDLENHRPPRAKRLSVPFVPPISLVNKLTLRPFNEIYYRLQANNAGKTVTHYEPFFYPLDNLQEWNRMYGPKGFYQYQCVVPSEERRDAVHAMLKDISQSGEGSFLAVLKTFGDREAPGMLSFPRPGVTLALDFPNRGKRTNSLFSRLDSIVREAKGRIYPAKDARMPRDLFESGYPRLSEFQQYRDPGISSALSRRLMGA